MLVACGCQQNSTSKTDGFDAAPLKRTVQQRFGTRFGGPSPRSRQAPTLTSIELPEIHLANAIWGATGRDDSGNVYLGISCDGPGIPSATLCLVTPGSKQATILGDAVSNLQRLGLSDGTTTQMKIHGKPVQANDGFVYFASMDERGEREDGSALPTHGSHLWRIGIDRNKWQHLMAAPEALIATGCTGRYVYALGYFNHVVYQYDTQGSAIKKSTVGSVGGHISRNFFVDLQEHVYVPRVTKQPDGNLSAELVELDTSLQEVTAHPLGNYGATTNFSSHGLVGFTTLRDGDMIFTTAKGALYRLHPHAGAKSSLESLGWIHPQGESYTAFLASPDGRDLIVGVAQRPNSDYEWLTYDVPSKTSQVLQLDEQSQALLSRPRTLVYGSNTLDDQGDAFVVGWTQITDGGLRPYALRASWTESAQ